MFSADDQLDSNGPAARCDRAMEVILIATLAFMPLAFGVVEAWSEEIVLASAAALCVCFLLKGLVLGRTSLIWTWAYVPILVFVAVVLIQLIPMPAGWLGWLSPNTVEQKSTLLSDLPNAKETLATMTVSFYTWATRHDLRLALAVLAVFVVVANVYKRPDQITRLLGAITAIGAGVALLAVAQNAAGNGKIYWCILSPHGTAHSGPFVNHSHYAQFMNLSIGAALGLVFVRVHRRFMHRRATPSIVADYLGSPEARLTWAAVGAAALGVASVFMSMSRGGMLSMVIAGAFTALIVSSKRALGGSGWIMALLALGAFICVLGVGFDAVYDRLGSLRQLQRAEGGRWQIVQDIAVAWTRFPLLGTGMGTHEVVYPMFDRSTIAALASHAENEYAQAAEETGAIGLAALVAFGILIWRDYARTLRAGRAPIHCAAYGLGFGLMAIMIHSLSDFGQHLPANAILSAIFCALLVRLSRMGEYEADSGPQLHVRSRRLQTALLAVVSLLWGGVLLNANAARVGEAQWAQVQTAEHELMERSWQGSDMQYTYLLHRAQQAVKHQPDNVKYRHWLNVYRWHAIARMADPNTGAIILPSEGMEFVQRIVDEFNVARRCCPTFGATWCVLGQLERLVLEQTEEGARHIRTGVKLAPCDPTARLVAGVMEAQEGRYEMAAEHLERAVRLNAGLFAEVAYQLVHRFDQPDLALQIAGDDVGQLSVLVQTLEASDETASSAERVREKVVALLEQKCRAPDAPADALAWLAAMRHRDGRVTEAIEYYQRALPLNYGEIHWHLNLATLLAETGDIEEAIRETDVCLRLRPGWTAAKQLRERLSVARRPVLLPQHAP